MAEQLLSGYRVLDLASNGVEIGATVLADLGADVIKIEPPWGDESRSIGPYYHDEPGPDTSLFFWAYNVNKRGITLNLATADGREVFRDLVRTADFLLESFPPGQMAAWGLGYDDLSALNPRLVMASVTPFGQSGPYSSYAASDLVLQAMGGHMYSNGDPDRPPVRISSPVSYLHAGVEAAVASLIAHWHREKTGEGQWIDVAVQPCVVWTLMDASGWWAMEKTNMRRSGQNMSRGLVGLPVLWECADGYTCTMLMGGGGFDTMTKGLVEWIIDEGRAPDWFESFDWRSWVPIVAPPETNEKVFGVLLPFLQSKDRWELMVNAVKRDFTNAAVQDPKIIRESPQLAAREFWEEIDHPELGETITYPSHWVRIHDFPIRRTRRAPLLGEHTEEILAGELGLDPERLVLLRQASAI